MSDPLFWLVLSLLVVCTSLAAFLVAAIPALRELGRASRSAEKLFDTLTRELPPTLEAIRLTGMEISDLTDDMTGGVQSAGQVVQKVDRGLDTAKGQAKRLQRSASRTVAGLQAAWKSLTQPGRNKRGRLGSGERGGGGASLPEANRYALPAPEAGHRPETRQSENRSEVAGTIADGEPEIYEIDRYAEDYAIDLDGYGTRAATHYSNLEVDDEDLPKDLKPEQLTEDLDNPTPRSPVG